MAFHIGYGIVSKPTCRISLQAFEYQLYRPCLFAAGQLSDFVLESHNTLLMWAYTCLPSCFVQWKAQEFEFERRTNLTFRLVNRQLQCTLQELHAACHYSFGGSAAFDVNVTVVGISNEFVSPAFKQSVKCRKINVAQKRRKVTALWRARYYAELARDFRINTDFLQKQLRIIFHFRELRKLIKSVSLVQSEKSVSCVIIGASLLIASAFRRLSALA